MKAGAMCMISRAQAQETRDCTRTLLVCAGVYFQNDTTTFSAATIGRGRCSSEGGPSLTYFWRFQ